MKLFVILAAVALANGAKLDKTYLPPSHSQSSGGSGSFLQAPFSGDQGFNGQANGFGQSGNGFGQDGNGFGQSGNGFGQSGNGFAQNGEGLNNDYSQNEYNNNFNNFESRPERAQAAFERNAAILRQDNQNDGETYSYAFETENGIYAEENGVATNGVEAQGGYSYTGDDGQVYSIRYTADQNGFVPQGDHLPTPPPVPEEILKALEQNARDEAAGIYDDGTYNEGKYANSEDQYSNNDYANNGNAYNNQNQYEGDADSVVTTNALIRNSGFNGNQGGFNGNNQGTSQAYLPPFAGRTSINGNANQGFNGNSNQGFPNGNGNQGFDSAISRQGTSQSYLPPFAGQRTSNGNGFNGQSNQGFSNGGANQGGFPNGNSNQRGFAAGASAQGASKEYLPPLAGQRNTEAGFGSRTRPSFSARNGYRY